MRHPDPDRFAVLLDALRACDCAGLAARLRLADNADALDALIQDVAPVLAEIAGALTAEAQRRVGDAMAALGRQCAERQDEAVFQAIRDVFRKTDASPFVLDANLGRNGPRWPVTTWANRHRTIPVEAFKSEHLAIPFPQDGDTSADAHALGRVIVADLEHGRAVVRLTPEGQGLITFTASAPAADDDDDDDTEEP